MSSWLKQKGEDLANTREQRSEDLRERPSPRKLTQLAGEDEKLCSCVPHSEGANITPA